MLLRSSSLHRTHRNHFVARESRLLSRTFRRPQWPSLHYVGHDCDCRNENVNVFDQIASVPTVERSLRPCTREWRAYEFCAFVIEFVLGSVPKFVAVIVCCEPPYIEGGGVHESASEKGFPFLLRWRLARWARVYSIGYVLDDAKNGCAASLLRLIRDRRA